MKKKVLLVMLACAVVFSAAGCSVTVVEETEKETEKKTEKETEPKTEKETETESEITLDTTVLDGTVTDWSDTEITMNDKDEKATYTINIADADWKLDDNGLYDGITVSVTLESATSKNGIFYAKELTELDDPAEDSDSGSGSGSGSSGSSGSGSSGSQTEAQTQAQTQAQTTAQTEAQTQAQTSAPSDDGTMYVEGEVTYADGAVITVDDYNGDSWTFDIAGASTELDANGLYEGIYVGVTASDTANSDGSYTADDVSEIDDPIEDDSENTMND